MALEPGLHSDHEEVYWRDALGVSVGTTEPDGGEVMIGVETQPRHWAGVLADANTARDIARRINELADKVEASRGGAPE
ncbi:hypothetical protein SEA_CLARKSON_16 [Mycobacterium phage Clarkson]|uniref:Uncharacterized protein n=3 Tax=Marvinvirus marvin TaxID=1982092 RepID=A0A5P8DD05_9CAUD|nr:hypothetical protein SEA_JOIEB_15 [Mycobacterium phage JoieB]QFP96878.1 hypothetical protein SEA_PRINGAR_14 [Mycobacterium phage Pringar]QFP97570.1 hypothetical protein SEA_CORAZON_14 [Mycobacterium phage Corazon]URP22507.1 hypothetical protein SEA_HUPHLEPUFF_16 [Mycobacterium phage Huphlepuff]WAA20120.1 hypothetical protein SEA_CLARKSON_16 [Mycobacterium phage Clarkson]